MISQTVPQGKRESAFPPKSHSHNNQRVSKEQPSKANNDDSLRTSYDENQDNSVTEKKDISLQVDKGIVEVNDDAS
jgi:hypothetical protein